ncbi:MAG: hypothetical protein HZB23_06045 [Deltaproteobacteria bacterium]|nr:hypothetical protein [Deltaproteobacteria bacterium]
MKRPYCLILISTAIAMSLVLSTNAYCESASKVKSEPRSSFTRLQFTHVMARPVIQSVGHIKHYEVTMMYPAGGEKATSTKVDEHESWEGPVTVKDTESGKVGTLDIELVSAVYYHDSTDTLLFDCYSGSMTYLVFVDAKKIAIAKTLEVYAPPLKFDKDKILVYPGCEASDSWSQCSSGLVLTISKEHKPVIWEKESFELTKKVIGIGYKGVHKIIDPGTKKARFYIPLSQQ